MPNHAISDTFVLSKFHMQKQLKNYSHRRERKLTKVRMMNMMFQQTLRVKPKEEVDKLNLKK